MFRNAFGWFAVVVLSVALSGCRRPPQYVTYYGPRDSTGAGPSDDQTPPEALAIVEQDPRSTGTCLFVVPAPEVGALEYKGVAVPGLTYGECVRRGFHVPVFKFIPDRLASYADVLRGGPDCIDNPCEPCRVSPPQPPPAAKCSLVCACYCGLCIGVHRGLH